MAEWTVNKTVEDPWRKDPELALHRQDSAKYDDTQPLSPLQKEVVAVWSATLPDNFMKFVAPPDAAQRKAAAPRRTRGVNGETLQEKEELPVFQEPPRRGQPIAEKSRVYLDLRPRGKSQAAVAKYKREVKFAKERFDIRWDNQKRLWYVSRAANFSAIPEEWLGPIVFETYGGEGVYYDGYTGKLEMAENRNRW